MVSLYSDGIAPRAHPAKRSSLRFSCKELGADSIVQKGFCRNLKFEGLREVSTQRSPGPYPPHRDMGPFFENTRACKGSPSARDTSMDAALGAGWNNSSSKFLECSSPPSARVVCGQYWGGPRAPRAANSPCPEPPGHPLNGFCLRFALRSHPRPYRLAACLSISTA